MTVGFGDSLACVDDEEGYVRRGERPLGVCPHPALERGGCGLFEAGRIDDAKAEIGDSPIALPAVSRQPRSVVDEGQSAADEPVTEGRLADIRSSQNGDREAHRGGCVQAIGSTIGRQVGVVGQHVKGIVGDCRLEIPAAGHLFPTQWFAGIGRYG